MLIRHTCILALQNLNQHGYRPTRHYEVADIKGLTNGFTATTYRCTELTSVQLVNIIRY